MKKYDCNKTLDGVHELRRICTVYTKCEGCPLKNIDCAFVRDITQEHVNIVQKWSDENPEPPKLTAEERAFVAAFKVKESKRIERRHGKVYVVSMYGAQEFEIWPSLFKFIEEGEHVPLTELMQLEVEE